MFHALGRLAFRRRWSVLAGGLVAVVVSVVWGTSVFGSMTDQGFTTPGSESARSTEVLAGSVGDGQPDVVVLYRSTDGRTVDDPAVEAAVREHLAALPADGVEAVVTWWDTGAPQLLSEDRQATYAVVDLAGDEEQAGETYAEIAPVLAEAPPGLAVQRSGDVALEEDITTQVSEDIARAETISLPVVMVLLVVVFGGLVAAGLPLLVGVVAILGAFTALKVLTLVTDVSIFSVNIVTMLGLGLAIDYALFVVSRFREELGRVGGRGADPAGVEAALVRTMGTAGRTVAVSGLTVAVSLASLLLFPQVFLRSMGFGGMAAVLVAMVAALTVLPAMLGLLGPRVDALQVPVLARWRARRTATGADGAWARVARSVMRRPVAYTVVTVALLLALGSPFLRFTAGGVDHRVLPDGTESREVYEALDRDFPGGSEQLTVAVTTADGVALEDYASRVAQVPGVTSAAVEEVADGVARVAVRHDLDPQGEPARDLVAAVRDVPAPAGSEALVGGGTAELTDLLESLGETFPWMALVVAGATLVLLFLAFGSVVLPVKALVMNVLSLTATFGVVVWGFQDGNLAGLLGFTETGTIEATQPVLMLAIAFGLSMDYEVFLLSRVREQWDLTHDNIAAVATGLQRTGGIITSAALLLVVVIGAFATSGITFITMIGVGLAVAIVVDATVVRVLLVPATMRLLGRWNWWAPRPLAQVYERFGLREGDGLAADDVVPGPRAAAAGRRTPSAV